MPPSQLGASQSSDPSQPSANIERHVQLLSLDKFHYLHRYNAITPSVCNLRPRAGNRHAQVDDAPVARIISVPPTISMLPWLD